MDDRMIVEVAMRVRRSDGVTDGMRISGKAPNRHYHLCKQIIEWGADPEDFEQGFITATGEFVDRRRAAELALACGQIKALKTPPDLYSEDLW